MIVTRNLSRKGGGEKGVSLVVKKIKSKGRLGRLKGGLFREGGRSLRIQKSEHNKGIK